MEKKSIDEMIYEETEKRLDEMQSDSYEFPKKMNKVDFVLIGAFVAVSVLLIVLCMAGVIN